VRLDVPVAEGSHQYVDALGRPEVPVEEDDVLPVYPAGAAAYAIADFSQQHFFAYLHAEPFGELLELVEECIVPPAHEIGF